jgi:hypothetical protein
MHVVWQDYVATNRYSETSIRSGSEVNQRGMNLTVRKNWSSAIGTTGDEE